jgi:hypothetical protein
LIFAGIVLGSLLSLDAGQSKDQALIGITVFRDPGFALPAAEVTVTPDVADSKKVKKMKASSDSRGEVVFRVPPGPAKYLVKATAKGFKSQEKTVEIQGTERTDVTFSLQPESK